jgi:serine acetyltransferase
VGRPVLTQRALVLSDLRRYRPDKRRPSSCSSRHHRQRTARGDVDSDGEADSEQSRLATDSWAIRHIALAPVGLDFAPYAEFGQDLLMHHTHGIAVGGGAGMGADHTLRYNVTLGERLIDGRPPHHYPQAADGVTIGAGACVLGAVRVGEGAVIGANSVVLSDVQSGCVAVGSPARVLDVESDSQRT